MLVLGVTKGSYTHKYRDLNGNENPVNDGKASLSVNVILKYHLASEKNSQTFVGNFFNSLLA